MYMCKIQQTIFLEGYKDLEGINIAISNLRVFINFRKRIRVYEVFH